MRRLEDQSVDLTNVDQDVLLASLDLVLQGYKCQRKLFDPSLCGTVFGRIVIERDPVPVPPYGKYDFKSGECDLLFWWGRENGEHVTKRDDALGLFIAATERSLDCGPDQGDSFALEIKKKIEKELSKST